MKRIFRYLGLSSYERLLIIKIAWFLIRAEIVLSLLPYNVVRKHVFKQKHIRHTPAQTPVNTINLHLKYLLKLSDILPWNITCLRKAVALRDSLAEDGVESVLKIGIKKGHDSLVAHAWLECCGQEILNNGAYNELTSPANEGS